MILDKKVRHKRQTVVLEMQGKESSWLYDFLIAVENIDDYPTDIQKFYWQIVGTLQ